MGSAALRTGRKLKIIITIKKIIIKIKNKIEQNKMHSLKGDITWTSSVAKKSHIKNETRCENLKRNKM